MKWFQFLNINKKGGGGLGKSSSARTYSSISVDAGMMRSGSGPSGLDFQTMSDISMESVPPSSPHLSLLQRPNNLRVFTFGELRTATKNFSRSMLLGEGGFGGVYRGWIKNSEDPPKKIEVAVKQLNKKGLQGHKEWLAEVTVLGIADHPNLVKLIGYCADDDERGIQRLLVYEYMPNGSVEDHLSARSSAPLSWPMRLKIALDAAKGLAYLHEGMDPQVGQIIFRDFKTSNILLDEEWNAKLSDFGMARQGPREGLSHVSTAVVGTVGYSAPEYIQSGHLTVKTDIWSYGVVLYELITGRRPVDKNRPKGEQKLLEWIRPYLNDPKKFCKIMDPRLDDQYSVRSAHKLSKVAMRCLSQNPRSRPEISKVLEMVSEILDNTGTGAPQPPLLSVSKELEKGKPNKENSREGCRRATNLKRKISELRHADNWRFPWHFGARKPVAAA